MEEKKLENCSGNIEVELDIIMALANKQNETTGYSFGLGSFLSIICC